VKKKKKPLSLEGKEPVKGQINGKADAEGEPLWNKSIWERSDWGGTGGNGKNIPP